MLASNIVRFDGNGGIEVLIDTTTGESFASVSGYARMSGKSVSTISRRLTTVASDDKKTAEIETSTGFRTVALIPAKLAFMWMCKDNPALAAEMGEVGATVYFHKLAGYKVTSAAVEVKPKTHMEMIAELALQMVADERRLAAVEEENARLKNQVSQHEATLLEMNLIQQEARRQLAAYPEPSAPAPVETFSMKISRMIADYSAATGVTHQDCFRRLYQDDFRRNHRNIRKKVEKGESKLQAAARLGWDESLYAIARDLFDNVVAINASGQ